ncbi:MAG: acetate--CoA ligase family protein [Candidatus Marsarchaeota archaeon]|jgi:succinyl-CoA synthetase beta subunit|nr:acetate--CoA ligase family protein [Candidatus Marsarchaeota archaeon]
MDYDKAGLLLNSYGLHVVESKFVTSADDAISFANEDEIVLKVITPKATHKTKNGLIYANLYGEEAIKKAYNSLVKRAKQFKPFEILAQPMIKNGVEIIIGGNTDRQFGKILMVGLGGIYVEVFKDVSARVCPINMYDAIAMINELKSKNIIAPNIHEEKLVKELILRVSKMFVENDIKEFDLNPIILHDKTYDIVDIRIL